MFIHYTETSEVKENEETGVFYEQKNKITLEKPISDLPDKDFKIMVIKMVTEVRNPLELKE